MTSSKFSGFHFKLFSIAHDKCAMKVGTDSIMLGSWVEPGFAKNILDIGSGSGVLAIMLAQKSTEQCRISGVDIDAAAVEQAQQNAANSPWPGKLSFARQDVSSMQVAQQYDLIISNPPYFAPPAVATNAYHKLSGQRQLARRTDSLSLQQLADSVARLLAPDGKFYCVLPVSAAQQLRDYAGELGLSLHKCLTVCSTAQQAPIRELLCLGFEDAPGASQQLTIYQQDGRYSADYKALCRDYYLNF